MFCKYTFSEHLLSPPPYGKHRVPQHLTQRPLKHNVEKETWKDFCEKTSHQLLSVIQIILHLGPLGCAGEHTLHYLDGQSLRDPSVFVPAAEHGSKNIIPAMCDFLCHINGTSRYVHLSLKPYFNVKVAKG